MGRLGSYEKFSDSLLFGGQRNADPMGDGSSMRADAKGKGRARPNGDVLALDLNAAEEGYGIQNGPFAQMQLVEQQVRFSWATMTFFLASDSQLHRVI